MEGIVVNRKKEIWDCSPEEMCRGYEEGENEFSCLLCGASFEKERVWPEGDQLYTAKGAVVRHIRQEHGDFCDWILQKNAEHPSLRYAVTIFLFKLRNMHVFQALQK